MGLQEIIVILIGLATAAAIITRIVKTARGRKKGCDCCGCCDKKENCRRL
ncbi:MAG: FeoB-associated Cys-rich membrane protein [Bacteroidetes bacterium]|uniref:FeoB-associated Cys-rich membrane protein n=1 Tax=Candidatus Merdivivens pullicola TaxID=2840872 RepID=A0A9D9IHW3_9BACT|nr:FeoB-associated Cys-rich membrane protein [Candidatus Merdivivens pullicola]